ncbi:MAG: hypothetical protein NZ899_04160 [Thermoguttaceae bacterium]|nr:hypothetical protein [Thermoguttaceae bacterium]MDW8077671.1 hypothetical protein [Thermoguttaceae bacterium]
MSAGEAAAAKWVTVSVGLAHRKLQTAFRRFTIVERHHGGSACKLLAGAILALCAALLVPYQLVLGSGIAEASAEPAARSDLASGPGGSATNLPPIVFTQIPRLNGSSEAEGNSGNPLKNAFQLVPEGGRLVVLGLGRNPQILTKDFQSAADPEVSFDGKRLLFAGKKAGEKFWQIYEVALDGSPPRQVAQLAADCRLPLYQPSLFTLDAAAPWYQVAFVSWAHGQWTEAGVGQAWQVYSCRLDGTDVRQLTFSLTHCGELCVVPDGRMVFPEWWRKDPVRDPVGKTLLMGINIDGTDYALFGEPAGKRFKRMPCFSPKGFMVFVEGDELGPYGSGQLGFLSYRRPLRSYQPLTTPQEGWFHSPGPLPDGTILVAHQPPDRPTFGIWQLDIVNGRKVCIFDDPNYDELQPRAIAPRSEADGRSSVVDYAKSTGKLYCLTAKISDLPRQQWPPSGKLRVRVLEGLPYSDPSQAQFYGPGFLSGSPSASIGPAVGRRFLGEFDLEADGSFQAEVPADIPLELQIVDESGLNVRSCRWIWVKPNENRGCIGCHEDGELTPPNDFAQALGKAAVKLTLPPERRRRPDFLKDVWPIVREKCVACHSTPEHPVRLVDDKQLKAVAPGSPEEKKLAWEVYVALVGGSDKQASAQPGQKDRAPVIYPGHARLSRLVWHVFGTNTARPWDEGMTGLSASPIPTEGKVQFTVDERQTLVEWIDLGANFCDPPRLGVNPRPTGAGSN